MTFLRATALATLAAATTAAATTLVVWWHETATARWADATHDRRGETGSANTVAALCILASFILVGVFVAMLLWPGTFGLGAS